MEDKNLIDKSDAAREFDRISFVKIEKALAFSIKSLIGGFVSFVILLISIPLFIIVEPNNSLFPFILLSISTLFFISFIIGYLLMAQPELLKQFEITKWVHKELMEDQKQLLKNSKIPLIVEARIKKFLKTVKEDYELEKINLINFDLNSSNFISQRISLDQESKEFRLLKKFRNIGFSILFTSIFLLNAIVFAFVFLTLMEIKIYFNELFIYIPLLIIYFFAYSISMFFLSKFRSLIFFTKWHSDELFEIQQKLLVSSRSGFNPEYPLLMKKLFAFKGNTK